jgi:uncharacterized protein
VRTLVAGGSGFLGRALCTALVVEGESVAILSRNSRRATTHAGAMVDVVPWNPARWEPDDGWVQRLRTTDAVINLAGESVAGRGPIPMRWSARTRAALRTSRLEATQAIVRALELMPPEHRPRVLINASAIGYYGDRGDEILSEDSPPGAGFFPELCRDWEAAAATAESLGVRVVRLRTGVVLERGAMAADLLILASRLGAGGRLGSGRQWWAWIHRADVIGLILHALRTEPISGAMNVVSPAPRRMADFPEVLGRLLLRPSWLPAPAFALRLVFGEIADALLLASQRVMPVRAKETGYEFRYPVLEDALRAMVQPNAAVRR